MHCQDQAVRVRLAYGRTSSQRELSLPIISERLLAERQTSDLEVVSVIGLYVMGRSSQMCVKLRHTLLPKIRERSQRQETEGLVASD